MGLNPMILSGPSLRSPQSFRTSRHPPRLPRERFRSRVDLTRSPSRRRMTGICAEQTAESTFRVRRDLVRSRSSRGRLSSGHAHRQASVALRDQTAVDVDHLNAAAGGRVTRSDDDGSAVRAGAISATRGSARHAGIAHRRRGAPDDRCALVTNSPEVVGETSSTMKRPRGRRARRRSPEGFVMSRWSLFASFDDFWRDFVDVRQILELNLLGARWRMKLERVRRDWRIGLPIGNEQRVLGTTCHRLAGDDEFARDRLAPTSIQICQSVSRLRKARCSHSTPLITPRPMCLASMTSALSTA